MVNLFKNFIFIPFLLILSNCSSQLENCQECWSFPTNYSQIIEKAQKGNQQSQEEISRIIYKGIQRYPSEDNKKENITFVWLKQISESDSFERKVSRLFFTHGSTSDAQNTFSEIKQKANEGDPYAQRAIGSLHFYTDLVEHSKETGIAWYLKAANQGHARAQMSLALRYLVGPPYAEKNTEEGMKWLKLASNAGLPEAQLTLSMAYIFGKYVSKDIVRGYDLLTSAAEGGDKSAKKHLAVYQLGILDARFSKFCNIDAEKINWP